MAEQLQGRQLDEAVALALGWKHLQGDPECWDLHQALWQPPEGLQATGAQSQGDQS